MFAITDALWLLYRWGLRLFDPDHPVSLTIRAEEAMGRHEWGQAFDLSHEALRKRTDFAPAFFVRGVARLNLDDYSGSLHDLSRFLALVDEPPALVYYWRGWIYAQREEWKLALADFDRVLAVQPDDPQVHFWRAYIFWQREEWEPMRASLDKMATLAPDHPLAWELRGHLHLHDGAFEEAESAYSRAMAGGWETPDLRYNRAVARRQLGQHEAAKTDIEAIFGMDPHNLWAHLELSNFAFAASHYDEALTHVRAALALDPLFFEARISEAAIWMALADQTQARATLEKLQQDFPEEPLVKQLYGDFLAGESETLAAIDHYRGALQQDGANHAVRVKLATELMALARHEEARAELEAILAHDPAYEDAYAARADLFRHTDQPAAMRADLDRLLALEPTNGWALTFRAAHRQWEGDAEGALADYAAAVAAESDEGWIWAFRGQFLLRAGQFEAARDDFQQAITLAPEDAWIRRQWAYLLFRCGYPTRAAEILDCLIQDEPEDGFARLFRADLHLLADERPAACTHWQTIVEQGHELDWLAHAALAVLSPTDRPRHLALADERRPSPSFWGATPATVRAQQALTLWRRGDHEAAHRQLIAALEGLEWGERPWLALAPLLATLDAAPLLATLKEWEADHPLPTPHAAPPDTVHHP